jgi:RNA-directed DNA polymerase
VPRCRAEGGKDGGDTSSEDVSTTLQQVAELARKAPEIAFTTLAHHVDVWFLCEALLRTRADGVPGADGQTAAQYARNLGTNLRLLLDRFKSGTYRAPAVRRVHIPNAGGTKTRPIGVPTFVRQEGGRGT